MYIDGHAWKQGDVFRRYKGREGPLGLHLHVHQQITKRSLRGYATALIEKKQARENQLSQRSEPGGGDQRGAHVEQGRNQQHVSVCNSMQPRQHVLAAGAGRFIVWTPVLLVSNALASDVTDGCAPTFWLLMGGMISGRDDAVVAHPGC